MKCRRNVRKMERLLARNNRIAYNSHSNKLLKLFVPTLIIVTFILFMIGPNVLRLLVSLGLFHPVLGYEISFILIPIRFMADLVIYIFSLKTVRLVFRKCLSSDNSRHMVKSRCTRKKEDCKPNLECSL